MRHLKRKLSISRTLEILGKIPSEKDTLRGKLRRDLNDIEHLITCSIKYEIKAQLRIQGHASFQGKLSQLIERPDEYERVAHQSYIEEVTTSHPQLASAKEIRRRFKIEIDDDKIKLIMQNACRIERTSDEPKLVVLETDDDIVITFAN